ncbi:MAG: hypothetical protein HPZ91_18595 [Lentisphaeria bacterium]|nr:hypothetical protein [Lentisphaeria bacterium]
MKRIPVTALFLAAAFTLGGAESPYGVCAHLNRMPELEAKGELAGIAKTGIGFVRTDLDWSQVEPEPGKWDFSRWDALVEEAEKTNVRVLPILCGEMPAHGKPPFRNMERWLNYVETCVKRYKGKIDCYEVINEADCDRPWGEKPDPENYAELLRKTYECIKRADPGARVLFTGVSDFGSPMEFVENVLRAGGGAYFDIMNFHPYQWRNVPESQLPLRIRDLKKLMRKYGVDKPVWITEIGNSSAPDRFPLAREVVPAALKKLGFDPARDTAGVIADASAIFFTGSIDDYLPEWKNRRELTFAELESVPISECPVLALPGREGFPADRIGAVTAYLRRGGTVILPGGFPCYFDFRESEEKGLFRTVQINDSLMPQLHIGWEAFWVKEGVPRTTTASEAGEAFPELHPAHRSSMRFLNGANLKGNDRMIPIVCGVNGGYKAPVAALYRLDSDLTGNLIVCADPSGTDSVTEEEQAQLLPREYLLALSEGVEKVFNYRFRAGEWNRGREAHFGIVRRSFEPKPAQEAYETLVQNLPPGSTRPELTASGGMWQARWTRPDGTRVLAAWTVHGKKELRPGPEFAGKAEDLRGNPLKLQERNGEAVVELSPSVVYLHSMQPPFIGETACSEKSFSTPDA